MDGKDRIINNEKKKYHRFLLIINRRTSSIRWGRCRCWRWRWRIVIIDICLFDKSCVHELSDMIDFGDIWSLFGIDDETSSNELTKLNIRKMFCYSTRKIQRFTSWEKRWDGNGA